MHVFDVCLPPDPPTSSKGEDRIRRAFSSTKKRQAADDRNRANCDPSVYRWKTMLASTCVDAFSVAAAGTSRVPSPTSGWCGSARSVVTDELNTVYLPGPNRSLQYDNWTDVLYLRFPPPETRSVSRDATLLPRVVSLPIFSTVSRKQGGTAAITMPSDYGAGHTSSTRSVNGRRLLDCQWSGEMAKTMRMARRIALHAGDAATLANLEGPLAADELTMLACTLYAGLEVLYVVVDTIADASLSQHPGQPGDYTQTKGALRAMDLRSGDSRLYSSLCHDDPDGFNDSPAQQNQHQHQHQRRPHRTPDTIWSAGRVYREVLDLERLGWDSQHPTYVFARSFGNIIRALQRENGKQPFQFQGVRVLMAEND
ncbi:hypothetical protein SPI_07549 [Niveomyces insectorum RCEF 264]|uniref:Uncharacterized protein n=1 Tax=Niveomyces insectorum RCEF 264 TaxID=1081102 RepID=A0A167PDA9_9HYPO|nr:hypothetical protein SPI_07549 [Niveomyces insectorum RCEF 264]